MTLNAEGTPYMLNYYPRVPNFTPFFSTIARFADNWGCWFLHSLRICYVLSEVPFEVFLPYGPMLTNKKQEIAKKSKCKILKNKTKQEAQGLGALLNRMEDDDHIKLDNIRDLAVRLRLLSKTCHFRGTRFLKIGKTPNDPQNYLKYLTSQVSCIHWILIPGAQISLRFALRPAIFKIQDCRKSEMHPMTPE